MASSMTGATGMRNSVPSGYQAGQMQQFTPEQMQLISSLYPHLGKDSYLSKLAGGDQATFDQMEAPAIRQFNGLQGQMASRFSGMGMGARRSSGFQNTSNQAASDFAQSLQANRQQLTSQALKDLMGMSNELLNQRPFQNYIQEKPKPFWQQAVAGALPLAGAGIGAMFGGMPGAKLGGEIGGAAGQAFM